QRFFDHGANTKDHPQAGPWLAMAYPRSLAVTAIAPNEETGLLEYCQPVEDLYAHAWRYFIRPSGRYDALWSSVGQSHTLFRKEDGNVDYPTIVANNRNLGMFTPPPPGGLDLAIPRIRPIAAPMILFSGRLDAPPPRDPSQLQPRPPGKTWQVVLSKHAEQSLVEKNRTLARRLAYCQLSVTLLRRFQYADFVGAKQSLYVSRDFLPLGAILQAGDVLTVSIGSNTTPITPTNLSDLVSQLTFKLKDQSAGTVELWTRSPNATALMIRSPFNSLKLTLTPNGGGNVVEWLIGPSPLPQFDQYSTNELTKAGPILNTGDTLELFGSGSQPIQITLPSNDVAGLVKALVFNIPCQPPIELPGSTDQLCRLLLVAPLAGIRLVRKSSSGKETDILHSRRPVPRWTSQPPSLPGAYTAIQRRDPLAEYQVEDVDELRQLNLPPRLGKFGQGAVVYQWPALPFYYQHLLLAVAQSTDVVSEITSTLQRDFEYVSPFPRGLMDGEQDAHGIRFRRILFRLENLWNSLPLDAQQRWPMEVPDTATPEEPRPYSASTDPVVIYQYVLNRPGGILQVLSQMYFNASQATGYEVRNFPVVVDGQSYTTTIVKRNPWGIDPQHAFEEYLETNLNPASHETVVRAITSRHAFDRSKFTMALTATAQLTEPADVDFFPRSAKLVLTKTIGPSEIIQLRKVFFGDAINPVKRDIAFQLQAKRFLERIGEESSKGLHLLSAISVDPRLVVIDHELRKVTWASNDSSHLFTSQQLDLLNGDVNQTGLRQSSVCGRTVQSLLNALPMPQAADFFIGYDHSDLVPTIGAAHPLSGRVSFETEGSKRRIRWRLGAINATELSALNAWSNPGSGFGESFRKAIDIIAFIGGKLLTQVDIQEPELDITEEISVGFDQLAELNDDPTLVIIEGKRLTWISNHVTNLFNPAQKSILEGDATHVGWVKSASCGLTIRKLLDADATND
ncbi:MAG: hypothetical protein WCK15_23960, partial [Pirellula sp.]